MMYNLNESTKDKILSQIEKNGLFQFIKFSGLSFTKTFSIVGDDMFNRKIMIRFIHDVCEEYGPFSPVEIDLDPIFYNKTDEEYREIAYIAKNRVIVDVWGEYKLQTNLGEFNVDLHALSDKHLGEVFDMVVQYLEWQTS